MDHQIYLDAFPETDTKGEIVEDRWQVGGPVPTALAVLSRFGMQTVFQGKWDDDNFGDRIESDLKEEGIQFDKDLCRTGSRTGFAHVWVERSTGRRTIAAYRGSHPVGIEDLRRPAIESCDALHLDGWSWEAAAAAARFIKEKGGLVTLDLGSPKPQLHLLLKHVDVLTGPESIVSRLFGKCDPAVGAQRLMELGPSEVVLTRGAEGAVHFCRSGEHEQTGFPVRAVDTNGAGDVFSGALIYGCLHRWPVDRKLRFACAAAALKCTQPGNRNAIPSLDRVHHLISED